MTALVAMPPICRATGWRVIAVSSGNVQLTQSRGTEANRPASSASSS